MIEIDVRLTLMIFARLFGNMDTLKKLVTRVFFVEHSWVSMFLKGKLKVEKRKSGFKPIII